MYADEILQQVRVIPYGRMASYGQIAQLCQLPGYARYVGWVLKQLDDASDVPWHRVVNSQGRIAFAPDSASFQMQCARLMEEGVMVQNGKVNLRDFAQ